MRKTNTFSLLKQIERSPFIWKGHFEDNQFIMRYYFNNCLNWKEIRYNFLVVIKAMLRTALSKRVFLNDILCQGFAKFDRSKPHVNGTRFLM